MASAWLLLHLPSSCCGAQAEGGQKCLKVRLFCSCGCVRLARVPPHPSAARVPLSPVVGCPCPAAICPPSCSLAPPFSRTGGESKMKNSWVKIKVVYPSQTQYDPQGPCRQAVLSAISSPSDNSANFQPFSLPSEIQQCALPTG